ncbi:hypothetical protein [Micromonospora purpureochromogenes]|uniref:Lipoprotein n=1 Tax=Micromonospora purpureochromogenes TaxID=47872 RepID=A0ABX2RHI5_9ACTN|nr:hypothetical protein [Micromonospora purpureochromogenes]NYF55965.1 hypothetical protein [Micromonospora purpureochromogenes]
MPPDAHRTPPRRLAAAGVLLAVVPLAACGAPPEPVPAPATSSRPALVTPAAPTAAPPVTPPLGIASTPSPTPGLVAVACAGRPSADRVVGLLRGRVLPRGVSVRATQGPLCAADWQYTVLAVTGHEELQVVTRTESTALRLVTAGTDVCSIEVRAVAPPGIRTLACDAGTGAVPGA